MYPEQNSLRTLELRDVIAAGVNIWDFEYPSYYKGEEKAAFEQKVIDHFYLRQIGTETVGRFLHYFHRTMREIMPLYIQRYKSVELMDDPEIRPLENYYMVEDFKGSGSNSSTDKMNTTYTSTGDSSGNGSRDVDNKEKESAVHSDTPQGKLMITLDADGVEETVSYASDITQRVNAESLGEKSTASEHTAQEGESENNHQQNGENQSAHSLTRRGNIGVTTYAQLLQGYRETFLNIDMEIIEDLEPCFLGVF